MSAHRQLTTEGAEVQHPPPDLAKEHRERVLKRLRRRGFTEADIRLTNSGHDFLVGLDAMERLDEALTIYEAGK